MVANIRAALGNLFANEGKFHAESLIAFGINQVGHERLEFVACQTGRANRAGRIDHECRKPFEVINFMVAPHQAGRI